MSPTELLGGAIGSTMLGLGGASIVAWGLRRRPPDKVLLLFGLWCGLYGARLIADQPVIARSIGGPPRYWEYFRAFVTYAINVPIGWFLESLIGAGIRQSIRRMRWVLTVFAASAIGLEIALQRPGAMMRVNSPLVVLSVLVALGNLWTLRVHLRRTFAARATALSAMAMLILVINENLGRPVVPSINLEPLGVFAFVASLGHGVVASVFRQEAELVAVQRELETARRIQASLLPRELPPVSGLDVAARYLPMGAVAGDLYDVVALGPASAGILVADVAGHGVPAALVASMVKLAFSTQAHQAHDPAGVLAAMNRILCHHVEGTFVTAVYAVIDTGRRTVTVANAGHPPLLLSRGAAAGVEECSQRGPMLGVFPDAEYANALLELRDRDTMMLYTDGIPETQSRDGQFYDFDRIKDGLRTGGDLDSAALADRALEALRTWRGAATFEDDVTLVVARLIAGPPQA